MKDLKDFTVSIAREAGALLKSRFSHRHTIDFKGEIDIVTEADRLSEDLLVKRISNAFPHHDILAEESAATERGARSRWIIDPLDGTTNYAHGFPVFCVSIALEEQGLVELGVIYNPMMDEIFVAQRGQEATLNGCTLKVSDTTALGHSLLATGFPYDIRVNPDNNIAYFIEMALRARAIRRAGSAALDLAYVAAGRFDGFWELRLHPWDIAAGQLLVREAGGCVTDIEGNDFTLDAPVIVASNSKIHHEMTDVLKGTNPRYGIPYR